MMPSTSRSRKGFTFVELLIVIVLTAMISAFAIIYSKVGERQVTLYVEEQKLASFIERARSLAVTIYNQVGSANPLCGYGLVMNYGSNPTYSLFGYMRPPGPNSLTACETIKNISSNLIDMSAGTIPGTYLNVPVNPNLMVDGAPADALRYVLFIAPNPRTIVALDTGLSGVIPAGKLYLQTVDGKASIAISVNSVGQVDF